MLTLEILDYDLSVCRLLMGAVPEWAVAGEFFSVTRRVDAELSVVCETRFVVEGVEAEHGWRAFAVVGPLDFSLTGILARLSAVLADAEISIFAVSTYDTDVILVKADRLEAAVQALETAGYRFQ